MDTSQGTSIIPQLGLRSLPFLSSGVITSPVFIQRFGSH